MSKANKQHIFEAIFHSDSPAQRRQLILELDQEESNPFVTIRLTRPQIHALAEYIRLLPYPDFRILCLYYSFHIPLPKLATLTGEPLCRGVILYCKDRLTQCMGLPRPVAEWFWFLACSRATERYYFPST